MYDTLFSAFYHKENHFLPVFGSKTSKNNVLRFENREYHSKTPVFRILSNINQIFLPNNFTA